MHYLLYLSVAIALLGVAASFGMLWARAFDRPLGKRRRTPAASGPYARQVDASDGPLVRHPRTHPRHEGG